MHLHKTRCGVACTQNKQRQVGIVLTEWNMVLRVWAHLIISYCRSIEEGGGRNLLGKWSRAFQSPHFMGGGHLLKMIPHHCSTVCVAELLPSPHMSTLCFIFPSGIKLKFSIKIWLKTNSQTGVSSLPFKHITTRPGQIWKSVHTAWKNLTCRRWANQWEGSCTVNIAIVLVNSHQAGLMSTMWLSGHTHKYWVVQPLLFLQFSQLLYLDKISKQF